MKLAAGRFPQQTRTGPSAPPPKDSASDTAQPTRREDTAPDPPERDLADDEIKIYVERGSAEKLEGTTIDFVTRLQESGFKFDNPNSIWSDPRAKAVQEVIDRQINPGIAAHGGNVQLLDVKNDIAYIAFGGGCQGCGMVDVTLKQGVAVTIKEAVPDLKDVLDTTDHAAGENPYYEGSNGDSPVADSPQP